MYGLGTCMWSGHMYKQEQNWCSVKLRWVRAHEYGYVRWRDGLEAGGGGGGGEYKMEEEEGDEQKEVRKMHKTYMIISIVGFVSYQIVEGHTINRKMQSNMGKLERRSKKRIRLCCFLTPGLRDDIQCHIWSYSFLCLEITITDIRPHLKPGRQPFQFPLLTCAGTYMGQHVHFIKL